MQNTRINAEAGTAKDSCVVGEKARLRRLASWIPKLERRGFVYVDGTLAWIECQSTGWSIIIEPLHPAYKTWSDIEAAIERQMP